MNITNNEYRVLRSLLTNDFGYQGSSEIWADCVNDSAEPSGLDGHALSGVVSSLNKKGLIVSSGIGRDAVISLTNAGREAAGPHPEDDDPR